MSISVFDLFKVGIGPSSSHTVGPMRAAQRFVGQLSELDLRHTLYRIRIELFGSLSATGVGHGTDKAVLLGLMGASPDTLDPRIIDSVIKAVCETGSFTLPWGENIEFEWDQDLLFIDDVLPYHPNAMRLSAFFRDGETFSNIYYSVGGGFVLDEREATASAHLVPQRLLPYDFDSGDMLLARCREQGLRISQLMLENEKVWREEAEIRSGLAQIWQVMQACIASGLENEGVLPGGLNVRRRAPSLYRSLLTATAANVISSTLSAMDWINLYALAVNEENAAGGRMVTAPTNGAAGIIPAVLMYYMKFDEHSREEDVVDFLLTAAAIGALCKKNASISGAEVGCQGEVGSACAMAAAGLTEVLGGTPEQVENAAEIALEHNLGLTCDPVGGLVQVPCIERNAIAAMKAINAAQMALQGDGQHFVSLDKVIRTMRDTGRDMQDKYKETSRGGLAVNAIEC
ncbi:L-serine ammonia-lyase [Pectobacteriaceae bacterium CE90]|nr:L-serine ammonia-lyase [Pectobacteriaceae bacterium CE90]